MAKKNAVILGGSLLNKGVYDKLHQLGLNVIVVDYRTDTVFNYDEHIVADSTDPEISQILREKGYTNICLVYTSMDGAGLAQRAICKEYGLLYASEDAMLNAHHKNRMHEKWEQAGLLNRQSFALQELNMEKISQFNKDKKIIIKPANGCASRGLTVIESNAAQETIKDAFNYARESATNNFINIEEFIIGTEYCVEMLGDNYGNVSVFAIAQKYHSSYSNSIVATKLHYNCLSVSHDLSQKITDYSIECYKQLGLKNTFGHLELLVQADGTISPIEVGARSSGYIGSHFTDLSTNKSFLGDFQKIQSGELIENGLFPQSQISSMYFFYDLPPNIKSCKSSNMLNFLDKEITTHGYDRSNLIANKVFQPLSQDTDRYGFEVLSGNKNILTIEHILEAEQRFLKDFFHE